MDSKYINPFKNPDWTNPGRTFEESAERVKRKIERIAQLDTEHECVDFDIKKMEESMIGKPSIIPPINTVEELDKFLNRNNKRKHTSYIVKDFEDGLEFQTIEE